MTRSQSLSHEIRDPIIVSDISSRILIIMAKCKKHPIHFLPSSYDLVGSESPELNGGCRKESRVKFRIQGKRRQLVRELNRLGRFG